MAASEVSVGLALVMQTYHQQKTLDIARLTELKDEVEDGDTSIMSI
jgi:NADH-quinone oxidoreductase subunit K